MHPFELAVAVEELVFFFPLLRNRAKYFPFFLCELGADWATAVRKETLRFGPCTE